MPEASDPNAAHLGRYHEAQTLYHAGREDEATVILEEIAGQGFAFAQSVLGNMLVFGPTSDPVKAKFWLEKAASHEIPEAYYGLGTIFLYGMGVVKSPRKAFDLFLKGTNLGDIGSSTFLGQMLAEGIAGEPRHDLAITAYSQAAKGGSAIAQRQLAIYYSEGIEVERDLIPTLVAHDSRGDSPTRR